MRYDVTKELSTGKEDVDDTVEMCANEALLSPSQLQRNTFRFPT